MNYFILLPDSRATHLPQQARKVLTQKTNPSTKKRRRKRNRQKRKGRLDQATAPRPKRRLRSRYVYTRFCNSCMNINIFIFLTKSYKIPLFSKRQNMPKSNKNSTSRQFDDNNVSARNCVCHIRLKCLRAGCKITLTPSSHKNTFSLKSVEK